MRYMYKSTHVTVHAIFYFIIIYWYKKNFILVNYLYIFISYTSHCMKLMSARKFHKIRCWDLQSCNVKEKQSPVSIKIHLSSGRWQVRHWKFLSLNVPLTSEWRWGSAPTGHSSPTIPYESLQWKVLQKNNRVGLGSIDKYSTTIFLIKI